MRNRGERDDDAPKADPGPSRRSSPKAPPEPLRKRSRRFPAAVSPERTGDIHPLNTHSLREIAAELAVRDSGLAAIMERFGSPPLRARTPGFTTLVHIILEQQVSLIAAAAIYRRLQAVVGRITPARIAALDSESFRSAGVTRQKAGYCRALAEALISGRLDLASLHHSPDETVREALLQLPGIGPWTVDIYLLMGLLRPDVWPRGDLALIKTIQTLRGMPQPPSVEEAAAIADRWRPWRSVAVRILWHCYITCKGKPEI